MDHSARLETAATLAALLDLRGFGSAGVNKLIGQAGGPWALRQKLDGHGEESPLMERARAEWAKIDRTSYREAIEQAEEQGIKVLIVGEPDYPANLDSVGSAPPLLWIRGTLRNLSERAVALVGATDPTDRGLRRARKFTRLCADHDIIVVSGLARGIDGESHRTALEAGVPTFAVMGHGLRHVYPPEHEELARSIVEQGGALISQFPPDQGPTRWTFPARNELMCTIAKGTVIIEIERNEKLGSVIQARFSIKHGRPVFVLRSNITELQSEPARELVEGGDAILVSDFDDLLECLAVSSDHFRSEGAMNLFDSLERSRSDRTAVLFDLDGVLYDPREVLLGSYQAAITDCTGNEPNPEELAKVIHLSPPKVFRKWGANYRAANSGFNRCYTQLVAELDCVFEPVVELLHQLSSQGHAVGVVTSQPKNRFRVISSRAGLDGLDVAVTWNDIPRGRHKPNPDPLLRAAELLRVQPRNVIYVGDSASDIEAARRAGMRSVAVSWGLTDVDVLMRFSPDAVVMNVEELQSVLASWVDPDGRDTPHSEDEWQCADGTAE